MKCVAEYLAHRCHVSSRRNYSTTSVSPIHRGILLSTERASGVWKTLGGKWQGACWAPELALTHEAEPFHERQVGMVVRTADQSQPDPNPNLSPDPTVDYQCVYLLIVLCLVGMPVVLTAQVKYLELHYVGFNY